MVIDILYKFYESEHVDINKDEIEHDCIECIENASIDGEIKAIVFTDSLINAKKELGLWTERDDEGEFIANGVTVNDGKESYIFMRISSWISDINDDEVRRMFNKHCLMHEIFHHVIDLKLLKLYGKSKAKPEESGEVKRAYYSVKEFYAEQSAQLKFPLNMPSLEQKLLNHSKDFEKQINIAKNIDTSSGLTEKCKMEIDDLISKITELDKNISYDFALLMGVNSANNIRESNNDEIRVAETLDINNYLKEDLLRIEKSFNKHINSPIELLGEISGIGYIVSDRIKSFICS